MKRLYIFPLLIFLLSSCATPRAGKVIEQGEASWYGPGFHGRQTANGETYDQDKLTAAHRTLPFNTVVRVINLSNGKSVVVRINDRGPYARGRIIDLSREAARRIDMVDSGVAPVRLVLVRSEQPLRTSGPGNIRAEEFTVQLASYNRRSDAEAFLPRLEGSKIFRTRVNGRTVYRIYYGRYRTFQAAERDLNR
ncbi:septal ring lytic transglycosylase RlpA family protein, partial [Balneolaceae bacterium ANBcel3]|nr:septal ring lytic transglycosylase RlpA family protein [Balneolaceae bacterium ANBcel3]